MKKGICSDAVNNNAYTCKPVPKSSVPSLFSEQFALFQNSDIDDCNPDPCMNGGMCSDGVNNYTCTCAPGYTDTNCTIGNSFVSVSKVKILIAIGLNGFWLM